jgi:hypothetical protein
MPSGGARTRSGPLPDPNSARSEANGWTTLPQTGRLAPAPEWPLTPPTDRESEMWERFWAKPQALIWERDGQLEYVAVFVRQLIEAEGSKASAENRKTVRMMFADLYLTSDAMVRARIRIVGDEVSARRPVSEQPKPARRLRAVDAQQ